MSIYQQSEKQGIAVQTMKQWLHIYMYQIYWAGSS